MKFTRQVLDANVAYEIPHNSPYVTFLNMGPGNLYVNVNGAATLDSLLIPAKSSRSIYFGVRIKTVSVIADDAALIQIDGLG